MSGANHEDLMRAIGGLEASVRGIGKQIDDTKSDLHSRIDTVKSDLQAEIKDVKSGFKETSERIGSLEKSRAKLVGIVSGISVAGGAASNWVVKAITGGGS